MDSKVASSDTDKISTFLSIEAINDDFFNEIVERKLKILRSKFKIRLVFVTPATGKNENFASVVHRVKISVELSETRERVFVDAIIKALIMTIPELKEFGVFPRERFMYEEVIPSLETLWTDVGGEVVRFGPDCYAIHSEPHEIIVLEDLKVDGYEILDRKIGVDADQAKVVMRTLARFHAASAVVYQKNNPNKPILDREISMPKFPKEGPLMDGCKKMMNAFLESAKTLKVSKSCIEKIASWDPIDMVYATHRGCKPMKCGFTVLNHGDDWINNMMFKIDENGQTVDFKLLDYQMSFWGSPAGDLYYFLVSSVRDEDKVTHFDEFIGIYYGELVESLRKLKYEEYVPSLEELKEELFEKRVLATDILGGIMFICKYTADKEINIGDFFSGQIDDAAMHLMYRNENFMKALEFWLPFFEERGFLDRPEKDNR